MATRVTGVRLDKTKNRIVRVHKLSVSKKIGARKKADREEANWRKKDKR